MPSDAEMVQCTAPWPGTAARLLEAFASLGPGAWPLDQICLASASGIDPGLVAGLGRACRYAFMRRGSCRRLVDMRIRSGRAEAAGSGSERR
jgi:hypothetical protein